MSEQKAPETIFISKSDYGPGLKHYWRTSASMQGAGTEVIYVRNDIVSAIQAEHDRYRAVLQKVADADAMDVSRRIREMAREALSGNQSNPSEKGTP